MTAMAQRKSLSPDALLDFQAGTAQFPHLDPGDWHGIRGGDLPHPVLVRLRETEDGRLICTGVMIGVDEDDEVTAADLRHVPLGSILSEFGQKFMSEDLGETFRFVTLRNAAPVSKPPQRKPSSKGPTDDELRAFADAYHRALVTHPRKAVKVAADARNISVPTAHRWKGYARDRGLLG